MKKNLVPPDNLEWKAVQSLADLPTEEKTFWCRLRDGGCTKLSWRNGNWVTWQTFHHPETDPLSVVSEYAPFTPKTPQTPEEMREYWRRQRQARRVEQESERREWEAAGSPKPRRLLQRKKRMTDHSGANGTRKQASIFQSEAADP